MLICKRNTLKVSYSCMPNIASIISILATTKNFLSKKQEPKIIIPRCNCRYSANCPLNEKCRKNAVIYIVSITSGNTSKHYFGRPKKFKTHYYNHTHSCRYRAKRNVTELSKAFLNAKYSGHEPVLKMFIANGATAYQPGFRSCNLCMTKKLAILFGDKHTALNKRSELIGKCRHKIKYKLKNF